MEALMKDGMRKPPTLQVPILPLHLAPNVREQGVMEALTRVGACSHPTSRVPIREEKGSGNTFFTDYQPHPHPRNDAPDPKEAKPPMGGGEISFFKKTYL